MLKRYSLFAAVGALLWLATPGTCQEPDRRPGKTFEWIDSRAGDCHMSGVLTLYPSGRAVWSATTWTDSTHDKDYWHETLRVRNAQGQELFGFGVWDSPPMDSPPNGGQYHWVREGRFSPQFFDTAVNATSEGSC